MPIHVIPLFAALIFASGGEEKPAVTENADSKRATAPNLSESSSPESVRCEASKPADRSPDTERGVLSLEPAKLTGSLATDRPGFADTTSVVSRGHVQMELGYTYTSDRDDGVRFRDHAMGQTNLRAGIAENLELRAIWSGYSSTKRHTADVSPRTGRRISVMDHQDGSGDLLLGLRTALLKNKRLTPDLTLLANVSIPAGSDNKTAGDATPDLRLAYGWGLTEKIRLYGVAIAALPSADGERFVQTSGSIGLSFAWNDRLSTFVEYYGIFPQAHQEDCGHNFDGGLSLLLSDNCQLDFSAGAGLNDQAPDYFVGMGISFRW